MRYVDSFKRQFVDQYVRLLKQQTAKQLGHALPECVCLIAVLPESEQALATCDVRPPKDAAGQHPEGVPRHDKAAAYVTNVAVDSQTRGQGLGFQLVEAAAALALDEWQAQALYTTVDPQNKVVHSVMCAHASDFIWENFDGNVLHILISYILAAFLSPSGNTLQLTHCVTRMQCLPMYTSEQCCLCLHA